MVFGIIIRMLCHTPVSRKKRICDACIRMQHIPYVKVQVGEVTIVVPVLESWADL